MTCESACGKPLYSAESFRERLYCAKWKQCKETDNTSAMRLIQWSPVATDWPAWLKSVNVCPRHVRNSCLGSFQMPPTQLKDLRRAFFCSINTVYNGAKHGVWWAGKGGSRRRQEALIMMIKASKTQAKTQIWPLLLPCVQEVLVPVVSPLFGFTRVGSRSVFYSRSIAISPNCCHCLVFKTLLKQPTNVYIVNVM